MNYAAIADAAAGLSLDDAFAAISIRIVTVEKGIDQRMINERTILSLIGMADGDAFMTALEASVNVPDRIKPWFKPSESGVDVLDVGSQKIIAMMVGGSVITQAQADTITDYGFSTVPEFGGVSRGHVKKAIDMRARGEV